MAKVNVNVSYRAFLEDPEDCISVSIPEELAAKLEWGKTYSEAELMEINEQIRHAIFDQVVDYINDFCDIEVKIFDVNA